MFILSFEGWCKGMWLQALCYVIWRELSVLFWRLIQLLKWKHVLVVSHPSQAGSPHNHTHIQSNITIVDPRATIPCISKFFLDFNSSSLVNRISSSELSFDSPTSYIKICKSNDYFIRVDIREQKYGKK